VEREDRVRYRECRVNLRKLTVALLVIRMASAILCRKLRLGVGKVVLSCSCVVYAHRASLGPETSGGVRCSGRLRMTSAGVCSWVGNVPPVK
jgi:hypothetical protein